MNKIERLEAENERLRRTNEMLQAEIDLLRQQAGLNAKPIGGRINWDREPRLGQMPDARLGAILGVSNTAVRQARQKRGVPSYSKNSQGKQKMIDYDAPEVMSMLGVLPDKAVARKLGVDRKTISYARQVRNIPAPPRQPPVNQWTMHRTQKASDGSPF